MTKPNQTEMPIPAEEKPGPNMTVWDTICETDPSYTKPTTYGARLTSISGQYIFMKLTREFGPVGKGWGYELLSSDIIEGGPMYGKKQDDNGMPVVNFGPEKISTVRVRLWYIIPGESEPRETFGTGHTPFVYLNRKYFRPETDGEYEKKSITDAIKKAATFIGMSADIHLGQFDDSLYVQSLSDQFALENAVDKEAESLKQKGEFLEFFERQLRVFPGCKTIFELEKLYKPALLRVSKQGTTEQMAEFQNLKNSVARKLIDGKKKLNAKAEAAAAAAVKGETT